MYLKQIYSILLFVLASLCTFPQLKGQIFVNAAATCGGSCDGSSWANAYTDLQSALAAANPGNEIWISAGTYTPHASDRTVAFEIPVGVAVYGGFNGTEALLAERNYTNNLVTLSGDLNGDDGPNFANTSDNAYTVVIMEDSNNSTILDGLTIQGGNANNNGSPSFTHRQGGGIYIQKNTSSQASPTIRNCNILYNQTIGSGGGVYNSADGATSNSYFFNCKFIGNKGALGGAFFNSANGGTSNLQFVNCDFYLNTASSTGGAFYGFITAIGSSTVDLTNCLLRENYAPSAGGYYALVVSGSGQTNVTNCNFYGNNANVGGAFYLNASFSQNNRATITNSIIWNSQAGFDPIFHFSGLGAPVVEINYSLVDANDCNSLLFGSGTVNCGGDMVYNQDPMFLDAVNGDFHISADSPAHNIGDNSAIQATGVSVDIDGDNRTLQSIVDLGIDEGISTSALPVELSAFDVKPQELEVLINWTTESEINNDYFTIERSKNGIEFEPIQYIVGAGESNSTLNYDWTDDNPLAGISYYRLKQTDFDGAYSFSPIKSVRFPIEEIITIHPNPVSDNLFLITENTGSLGSTYAIYDLQGKKVFSGQIAFDNGQGIINQTVDLNPGAYLLRIDANNQSLRFVKQ